ncbi:MAG: PSD1 and planctomycete cytochrome C domain-containing protein [Pirellulales bacterium]
MKSLIYRMLTLGIASGILTSTAWAQTTLPKDQEAFFEKNIRPALVKYCYECHSEENGKTRGGLLVDTRDGLLQGGDSGPSIDGKIASDSVLYDAITWGDYKMPPKNKMPNEVISHFKTWIEMGSPDPRVREKLVVESVVDIEAGKKHWAFQKPHSSSDVSIDSLVLAKQSEANISAVEQADALTLLRRMNYDLLGLPPTATEARAFFAAWKNDEEAAIEAKLDELMARSQFGERWGRHWLDVARYAESSGKDANFTFPHAWRYRDYVFDAFNDDKPYDQFIQEQIAGDLLPAKTDEKWQENLIATGFLAMGTKGLNERNPRLFRMDMVDEQIDTMSQSILGLTVSCARCHDHKFDPIPTVDYYALAGIFMSTQTYYGTQSGLQNQRPSDLILLPIEDKESLTREYSNAEIQQMRDQVASMQSELRSLRIASQNGGKQVEQRQLIAMRNRVGQLEGTLSSLDSGGVPKTFAMGVQDAPQTVNAHVLVRGDVEKPAQEVERGFLQVLEDVGTAEFSSRKSGRRELAQWLTSKENPLTARVMVNRIWQHLLGDPVMGSPNNWGTTGQQPNNPELLDHLAVRFMENDWSMKSMIKEIMLSDTYQRSSEFQKDNYETDPANKLLWRTNSRQLDAEALRDSMLMLGGNLNLDRPLGSDVAEIGNKRVERQVTQTSFGSSDTYRSVYLPVMRDALPEALDLFDFADPNATNPQRDVTNVPTQALYMMNSKFVYEQATDMAKNLEEHFDKTADQVKWAFIQAYGRPATDSEIRTGSSFIKKYMAQTKSSASTATKPTATNNPRFQPRGGQFQRGGQRGGFQGRFPESTQPKLSPELQALTVLCQGLMASAEFRILN